MSRYINAELVKEYLKEVFENFGDRIVIDSIVDEIPTADVEPVVYGEWIAKEDTAYPYLDIYSCSNCGAEPLLTDDPYSDYHNIVLSNLCPHCGAKMDGEHNDL